MPPAALTVPAAPGASWQHGELSFRTPASTALPGARKLGRSLRALKRRVPARTGTVLDEIATADRAADGGLWLPVLRPGTERWLDLAVVVDQSPSMAVWARAVEELRGLLERLGAFRDVRIWLLETGETPVLRAGTASGTSRPRTASPRDLLDPGGRRLILVVSDCVGDGWHTGAVPSLLHLWGGQGPVAIVQVLPQRLWRYTAVRTERVELRSPYPGAPNERLRDAFWAPAVPRTRRRRNAAVQAAAVPVPVVPLETRWLAPWSALVAGAGGRAVPSVVTWVRAGDGQAPPQAPDAGRMTAEERLRQFRAVVSPEAFQLAGYLAAVPLTLPVMRLVQEAMMPGTGQAHLAEVLLTVLERKTPEDAAIHPDDVGYDFADGVRDLLLDTVLGSEVLSVLHTVGDFVGRHSHRGRTFASALLEAPDGDVSAGERAFALVSAATLRRFGPDYTGLADRLEGRPAHVPQPGARLILDVVPIRREDGAELLALRAEGRDRLSVMPVTSDEPALALSRYRPGVEAARSAGRRLHDAITVDPEVRDLLRGRPGTLLAPADSLPWESLCTPDGRFLAVDEGWGVGRFFEHRSSSLPYWPIVGPVRVLAILASPVVTGDAEFEALLQASGPTGGGVQMLVVAVEERILEHARRRSPWLRAEAVPPTVTGLRDLVRSFRPQVVHIFGYAEAGPAPTLELGTRAGMTSRVPSATLQVGPGSLRGWWDHAVTAPIVVVMASESAPFCRRLVDQGSVIAAIGMRSHLTVPDSASFTSAFYRELLPLLAGAASGSGAVPVDLAALVTPARRALAQRDRRSAVWTMPIVYTPRQTLIARAVTAEAVTNLARADVFDEFLTRLPPETPAEVTAEIQAGRDQARSQAYGIVTDAFDRESAKAGADLLRPSLDHPALISPGMLGEMTEVLTYSPRTLKEVQDSLRRMAVVFDELPPLRRYHAVRMAVADRLIAALHTSVSDPRWFEALAIDWSRRYRFALLEAARPDEDVSAAWQSFFRRAVNMTVSRHDAAALGMNVALNLDLPLTLVRTWEEFGAPDGEAPGHDYLLFRRILKNEVPALFTMSARIARRQNEPRFQPLDGWTRAMFADVFSGRAWDQALRLWPLHDDLADRGVARETLDAATAQLGELLMERSL